MTVSTGGADWRDGATAEQVAAVEHLYRNHRSLPYISPERDLAAWLEEVGVSSSKAVPKWALEPVANIELYGGYLFEVTAGDIILLWRISFDTFTTQSWFPKYFEHTYGIDAAFDLRMLVEAGLVEIGSATDSLDLMTAPALRKALKDAGVNGLSSAKKADLDDVIDTSWTPHVTRGVRLVSMIDDAAQHVGQAAYAAGILAGADGSVGAA